MMLMAWLRLDISIHALRKESDRLWNHHASHHQRFQSTLSVRRATSHRFNISFMPIISIHALRKESDVTVSTSFANCSFQSTLSVRRATDVHEQMQLIQVKFQSTLSVRRATCGATVTARS